MKSFILHFSLLKGKSNSKLATERGSYLFVLITLIFWFVWLKIFAILKYCPNLFFIDIVELYNSVIKYYKQSLQIEGEKKANLNILTRLKHAKDPMINTLNNMLMVCNLPTIGSLYSVTKILNINLKFGEWTWFLIYIYNIPFACICLILLIVLQYLEKFGIGIYLLSTMQ